MNRAVTALWLFLAAATVSGGLLGRYVATMLKGWITPGTIVIMIGLGLIFAFSVTILVRIVRASARCIALNGTARSGSRIEIETRRGESGGGAR